MYQNATGYYPYGDLADGGGDGILRGFDGETARKAPKGDDDTCIGGRIKLPPYWNPKKHMTNTHGCGKGYASYDEHPGYDYYAAFGTPVYAAASGRVLNSTCYLGNTGGTCAGWGAIGIDHGNGYISQYLHMDPSSILVSAGQHVAAGQQIGEVSDTGLGCDPHCYHLHFEVRATGPMIGPEKYPIVDPYGWTGKGSDPLYSALFVPPKKLWIEKSHRGFRVLYSFKGGNDGSGPYAGVSLDGEGNLYGTTADGGADGDGVVFKLTPDGTETVLHSFGGGDGANPFAGVSMDGEGNLYGTTADGGADGDGVVFKLTPDGTETVLHSFGGGDGANPFRGVSMDGAGNLYGTTYFGGANDAGVVFKLTPDGTETVLHSFGGGDGANPLAGVSMDGEGNLYGTTVGGHGVVFKLTP